MQLSRLDIERRMVYPDKLRAYCADTLIPSEPNYKEDLFVITELLKESEVDEVLDLSPIIVIALLSEDFEFECTREEFAKADVTPRCSCLVIYRNKVYAVPRTLDVRRRPDGSVSEDYVWNSTRSRDDLIATDGNIAVYGDRMPARMPKIIFPPVVVAPEPGSAKNWTRYAASIASIQLNPVCTTTTQDAQTSVLAQDREGDERKVVLFFPVEFTAQVEESSLWKRGQFPNFESSAVRSSINVNTLLSIGFGVKAEPMDIEDMNLTYATFEDLKPTNISKTVSNGIVQYPYEEKDGMLVRKTELPIKFFTNTVAVWMTNNNQTFVLYRLPNGKIDFELMDAFMMGIFNSALEFENDDPEDSEGQPIFDTEEFEWRKSEGVMVRENIEIEKRSGILIPKSLTQSGENLPVTRWNCPKFVFFHLRKLISSNLHIRFVTAMQPIKCPAPAFARYARKHWEISRAYWDTPDSVLYHISSHSSLFTMDSVHAARLNLKEGIFKIYATFPKPSYYHVPGKFLSFYFFEQIYWKHNKRTDNPPTRKEFFFITVNAVNTLVKEWASTI